RIGRNCDCRINQDRIGAHLHRFSRVTWHVEPRVHDYRHGGLLDNDFNLQARLDSPVAADRRTERHYGGGADVLQSFREYRVGIDIGKNRESFFHQNFRSSEGLHRIRQQITRVRVNLELDPFWQARARGQPREAHRFVRVARTARVGQKKKTFWIDRSEEHTSELQSLAYLVCRLL